MKTSWYIVIESQGAWWVDYEGHAFGPASSKEEADRYARRIADVFGDKSRRRDVWLPNDAGKLELVWSIGPEEL